ncbi:MAG: prolyl oligopeptidase family serine peptidase [Ignavibacteria bacterium]|jgi:dipeptidyl aminopeptidase/acylaminoacyl peptidase|nr:prolyl oligopeptidase family serine peptidase [Ignavibacteria bacterium]MCU7503265.1 prolyl oligopeptidase family serine peptidase [Ignavibacteria bacterium]MCU7515789.1 prolyl oligopeptidase family serine peptidase [Ignavibacteria bacterium]
MSEIVAGREVINLNPSQLRMIKSGWGEAAVEDSTVEKMTYISDGLRVKGFIAYPKEPGNYPCVIWNRGGLGSDGAIDDFTARGIFGQLAGWGYVVLASQYRGSPGGEGKDEFGGNDVNDVLNLMPVADMIPGADTSRWAMEGWSRGGMMTYLALTRNHNFKTAIISGGIADLHCNAQESRFMRMLYEKTLGSFDSQSFKEACFKRSIINFPEKLPKTTPLFLIHGTSDERVAPGDSLKLSEKLLRENIPFRLVMIENGDHYLRTHKKEVDQMRRQWLDKYLKK